MQLKLGLSHLDRTYDSICEIYSIALAIMFLLPLALSALSFLTLFPGHILRCCSIIK